MEKNDFVGLSSGSEPDEERERKDSISLDDRKMDEMEDLSRVTSTNDLMEEEHDAQVEHHHDLTNSEIASPTDPRVKRRMHFPYKVPKLNQMTRMLKRKSVANARSGHEPWKKPEPAPKPLNITVTYVQTNEVKSISLQELCEMRISLDSPDEKIIWIDIESPTDSDMKQLETKFTLHPLTTEDILNTSTDAREKTEAFEHYLFVVTKEMGYLEGSNILVVSNINIIVFPRVVLSIHPNHISSVSMVSHRISLEASAHKTKQDLSSPDWVMYAILDAVTDMYVHHVNGLTAEGENLDEIVLAFNADEREDVLRRIGLARHFVINLLSHLWAKRELVTSMINKDSPYVMKNTKVYLRDVMDHTLRMEEKLRVTQEILNYTSTTYLSRVSIEAAEASNKMNAIMKRFGVAATLFLPLNLLAGIFGMNVKVPARDEDDYTPFLVIVGFMLFSVISMLTVFWKKNWLG